MASPLLTSDVDICALPPAPLRLTCALRVKGQPDSSISIELTPQECRIFRVMLLAAANAGKNTIIRVAGGWVRDKLLGRTNHDIDVALDNCTGKEFGDAVNETLQKLGASTHTVAVIKANPEQSKHLDTATTRVFDDWIDFVNLRCEVYDADSRIPRMSFGTAEQDAERRDFTVNALFYNVTDNAIEDLTGRGVSDLASCTLRTPLPPSTTFFDDPLRVLRAIRFSSRFSFAMVPELHAAATDASIHAALASKISRERIGNETEQMLAGARPIASLRVLHAFGLLDSVFAAPPTCNPNAFVGSLALPPLAPFLSAASAAAEAGGSGGSATGGAGGPLEAAFPARLAVEPIAQRLERVFGIPASQAAALALLGTPVVAAAAEAATASSAAVADDAPVVTGSGSLAVPPTVEALAAQRAPCVAAAKALGAASAAAAPAPAPAPVPASSATSSPVKGKGGKGLAVSAATAAAAAAGAGASASASGLPPLAIPFVPYGHWFLGCGQPGQPSVEPLAPLPMVGALPVEGSAGATGSTATQAAAATVASVAVDASSTAAAGGAGGSTAAAGTAGGAAGAAPSPVLVLPSSWLTMGLHIVEAVNLLFALVPGPQELLALHPTAGTGSAQAAATSSISGGLRAINSAESDEGMRGTNGDTASSVCTGATASTLPSSSSALPTVPVIVAPSSLPASGLPRITSPSASPPSTDAAGDSETTSSGAAPAVSVTFDGCLRAATTGASAGGAVVGAGEGDRDGDAVMAGASTVAASASGVTSAWSTGASAGAGALTCKASAAGASGTIVVYPDAATGLFAPVDTVTALETRSENTWHTYATTGAPSIEPDERRTLLYAALLFPLSTVYAVNSKGKPESLVFQVLATGLKRTHKEGEEVCALHAAAIDFARQMRDLAASRHWHSTGSGAGAEGEVLCLIDRLRCGLLIKNKVKAQWPLALYLATALNLVPVLAAYTQAGRTTSPSDTHAAAAFSAEVGAVLAAAATLGQQIKHWRLDTAYNMKPLLDGKAIMGMLGIKNGKEVGTYVEEQVRWQLLHPDGSSDQAAARLQEYAKELAAAKGSS